MDSLPQGVFAPLLADEVEHVPTSAPPQQDGPLALPHVPDGAEPPIAAASRLCKRKPDAIWLYKTVEGRLASAVIRLDEPENGKSMLPLSWVRHPNGQEGWGFKQPPAPRLLYNADQLAARSNVPVIVCEGEKTADAVARLYPDAVATTSPGGAHAAKKADWSPLKGRKVVVCPDANDKPDQSGQKPCDAYAMEVIAAAFAHGATEVHLVDTAALSRMLPDGSSREGPTGWDLADALDEGWDLHNLRLAIETHSQACRAPVPSTDDAISTITSDPDFARTLQNLATLRPGDYQIRRKREAKRLEIPAAVLDKYVRQVRGDETENERERSQRDILVELASGAELWRDETGDAYATVQEDGVSKTFRIRTSDCRGWLIRSWMAHHDNGGLPSATGNQALQDTLNAIEARAQQGPVHPVFVRIGHHQDHVYVDLGDERWRAVEISAQSWRVVDRPPVRFIRTSGQLPLPEPVRDPNGLPALLSILPDGADAKDAKILLLSFLLGVYMPNGSLPLLALSGRQGSGKSTLTRHLRHLIDSNQAPARQQPRNDDDLIIAAKNGALVAYDNLSRLTTDLSDALCRLATGAGFSKRRLYTDGDELIVQVRRPVIINGIADLVRMPDLADRAIFVDLPPRSTFQPEMELEKAFEQNRSAMLGVIYDAISAALRGYAEETCSPGIRLADFERWVRAAAPVLGLDPQEVSRALGENRLMGDRMLIEDDLVASLLVRMLDKQAEISGTPTELFAELRLEAQEDAHLLPKGPRALSAHLKRFVPAFERTGIILEQSRVGHDRQRQWTIRHKGAVSTVREEF
jgi:putative DNA primase/helicase